MKYAHQRQHTKKQESRRLKRDGSKWIVMDNDIPVSERLSRVDAIRFMRRGKTT